MSEETNRKIEIESVMSSVSSFFFSSRRRHTRFKCDWSSDVCSSDLPSVAIAHEPRDRAVVPRRDRVQPPEGPLYEHGPVLGVELLRDRRRAGDVGEQDRKSVV